MKKNPVQIKIGFLMVMAVVILSATGYLSYRNISSIVSSIHVDVKPDLRMLTIREISMELEKAENSIRLYTVTSDSLDLRPYFKVIWHINEKIQKLRTDCANDSLLLIQTDTIGRLIKQNIVIWAELLNLTNSDKMSQELRHLSDSLNIASANALKPEIDILNKTSNRKYKSPINEVELISNLTRIEQQDRITKEKKMAREAQLAITGSQMREKFYEIISKMESEVTDRINKRAFEAHLLAEKTYRWITMFALSGTLLAILVMFIIVRYARKTHASQVALENSKNEAEKLARTKEMFMANMSHEIRTPVAAISGFTEQLLFDKLDEHTSRILKIIKSSSDHLANIINDILDFSKLQNDKLVLEKVHFNIMKVMEDAYVLFEKQAQRNNTSLSYSLSPDTPPALLGDPYRLKQIMINLVSNAVKFTANGKVHFSVKCEKRKSAEIELVLEVIDSGIGIEEGKIDSIFDDFTQAEMSTTRKYGGTGLGLSIVKKLVELHGGTIECNSRKNVGTHITCHLKYHVGEEKMIKSEVVPILYIPDEIRKLSVLVVDDEEYNRLLFKTIMNRWNVKNSEAPDGREAIEMIKNNDYDLLFMDARMPGLDGLKVTQIIRNDLNKKSSDLPVICISAASLNDDWDKYEKAGMNAFLEKPFTEELLMTTILNVLRDVKGTEIANAGNENQTTDDNNGRVNLQNLFHIAGGDKQFTKQMLVTFLETTTKGLEEMTVAATSGNWNMVAELAHKMLPPARHIGATGLSNYMRRIEESTKNNSETAIIEALIKETYSEFEVIRDLLHQQITKIT